MRLSRVIKAVLFILLHAAIAVLLSLLISPGWLVVYGIIGAALATLMLVFLAGDEKSAELFFAENWQELEDAGTPLIGLVITFIGLIWLVPLFCFLLMLVLIFLRREGWF